MYRLKFPLLVFTSAILSILSPLSWSLDSAKLLAVVSERSASELAAAAHHFHDHHPQHQLVLRTTRQLSDINDVALRQLLTDADTIIMAGVFGEVVERMLPLFDNLTPDKPLLVFHSDHRLVRETRIVGRKPFQNMAPDRFNSLNRAPGEHPDLQTWLAANLKQYPTLTHWLRAKVHWQSRGRENLSALLALALSPFDPLLETSAIVYRASVRFLVNNQLLEPAKFTLTSSQPVVAVLDLNTGDRAGDIDLHGKICDAVTAKNFQCVGILAQWGTASADALELLHQRLKGQSLAAIVSLQDFFVGGSDSREQAVEHFESLNVPVIKGIRLSDRTREQWHMSADGLPWDDVHYQLAMPELQGVSQPMILAVAGPRTADPLTGVELMVSQPLDLQVNRVAERIKNWHQLTTKANADKKLAIIYYNHPPGRHNIGADNLDVPATLWTMLKGLQAAGYHTGPLPESQQALLDRIQEEAVNLPENHQALAEMSNKVVTIDQKIYQGWFREYPQTVQQEMINGPLGYLQEAVRYAVNEGELAHAQRLVKRTSEDLHHVLEGLDHPARNRALDLLDQLEQLYLNYIRGDDTWTEISTINKALVNLRIEGLRGWGQSPGKVMVYQNRMLLPGIRFGNIFIGPQPPRGWEINEELLHANMSFPPTHQYLAFYEWLKREFQADALIHLGRHSTYEFLPRRSAGLANDDYPSLVAGELPGIYPYIVDGVGEGIQAKRRGLAVMIDHLTPPISTSPLYDNLLKLRQLIESYEAANPNVESPSRTLAVKKMRELIDTAGIKPDLIASMDKELKVRGIPFDAVDDDMLVHEIGHYLTDLQEQFMPLGLHVFGRPWDSKAIDTMYQSMTEETESQDASLKQRLADSPALEWQALLNALNGGFVKPGKGNDPIRTPEALPTGRNFHALDSSLLPTRLGYEVGQRMSVQANGNQQTEEGKQAIILWASDTVRDEGAMIAFGLQRLGIRPVWNSRGIVKSIERIPLAEGDQRHDVVFITSGLFRDLYAQQLKLLDKAVLLALDASSERIRRRYPALGMALDNALEPLGELASGGDEPLETNQVARHWIRETESLLRKNDMAATSGRQASLRIFGVPSGAYGAGINRLVERSGSWDSRDELGDWYIDRMGHAYGIGFNGEASHEQLKNNLQQITQTYLGRASNLYGLIDNNDAFDYLGGLSLAVETITGKVPQNFVVHHADATNPEMQSLDNALLQELRGRFFNPAWLKALMQHDYAGARTMGSEFLEYLWGWQVTNPNIIKSWVWDEVKAVYIDDRHQLGLDDFLEKNHNVQVKTNMMAILLVAAYKEFWQPDETTLQEVSRQFAELIIQHGLPGSGHTAPDHPLFQWLESQLSETQIEKLNAVLDKARLPQEAAAVTTTLAEVKMQSTKPPENTSQTASEQTPPQSDSQLVLILATGVLLLLLLGIWNGRRARQ